MLSFYSSNTIDTFINSFNIVFFFNIVVLRECLTQGTYVSGLGKLMEVIYELHKLVKSYTSLVVVEESSSN